LHQQTTSAITGNLTEGKFMVRPSTTGVAATSRKFFLFAVILLCTAPLFSSDLFAQSDEWKRHSQQARVLRDQGDYNRATESAQKALESAERELGADHSDVAIVLNNLAAIYQKQ